MTRRFLATFAVARRSPEGFLDSPPVATARGQKIREVADFRMGSYCACSRPAECRSARVSRPLVWRSMTPMARVLLADSQPRVNEGREALLSRGDAHQVIGRSSSAEETLMLVGRLCPDLVLIDAVLGLEGSPSLVARVLESRPEIKVLVLGDDHDPDLLMASIRAGAA